MGDPDEVPACLELNFLQGEERRMVTKVRRKQINRIISNISLKENAGSHCFMEKMVRKSLSGNLFGTRFTWEEKQCFNSLLKGQTEIQICLNCCPPQLLKRFYHTFYPTLAIYFYNSC